MMTEGSAFKVISMRIIVALVVICYLLNPLQNEIREALHTLSHEVIQVEMLMSYNKLPLADSHDFQHDLDTGHDHLGHGHSIIEIIDSFLGSAPVESTPANSPLTDFSIDKHLAAFHYVFSHLYMDHRQQVVKYCNELLLSGFTKLPLKPPI